MHVGRHAMKFCVMQEKRDKFAKSRYKNNFKSSESEPQHEESRNMFTASNQQGLEFQK